MGKALQTRLVGTSRHNTRPAQDLSSPAAGRGRGGASPMVDHDAGTRPVPFRGDVTILS